MDVCMYTTTIVMYDAYEFNQVRGPIGRSPSKGLVPGVWRERGMGGPYIYIIYMGSPHVPHVSSDPPRGRKNETAILKDETAGSKWNGCVKDETAGSKWNGWSKDETAGSKWNGCIKDETAEAQYHIGISRETRTLQFRRETIPSTRAWFNIF